MLWVVDVMELVTSLMRMQNVKVLKLMLYFMILILLVDLQIQCERHDQTASRVY